MVENADGLSTGSKPEIKLQITYATGADFARSVGLTATCVGLATCGFDYWNIEKSQDHHSAAKKAVVEQASKYAKHTLMKVNKDMSEDITDSLAPDGGLCVDCVTLSPVACCNKRQGVLEDVVSLGIYWEPSYEQGH